MAIGSDFTVGMDGLEDVNRLLEQLPKRVRKTALNNALKKASGPTLLAAQAQFAGRGTGNLADSITVQTRISNRRRMAGNRRLYDAIVYVGSTAPHAHLVEFGTAERFRKPDSGSAEGATVHGWGYTGRMKPNPFLTRAWDATKRGAVDIMEKELWKEVEKGIRRLTKKAAKGTLSWKATKELMA